MNGKTSLRIFLIALDDGGKVGEEIGCGDSIVPVVLTIPKTQTPLRASIEYLLSLSAELPDDVPNGTHLFNPLYRSHLTIESIAINNGKASIRLLGDLQINGVCDGPRFVAQFEKTAKQFSTVKEVEVFINSVPLEDLISEQ